MKTHKDADQILRETREFVKNSHRKSTWRDYERFKQKLLDNGQYGYEGQLADILKL